MRPLQRYPAGGPAGPWLAALADDGAVALDGAVDPALCRAVAAELGPHLRPAPSRPGGPPPATLHATGLLAKSASMRTLAGNPAALAACDALLLPGCSHYQIHATRAFGVLPGAPAQRLHREDDGFPQWPQARPRKELIVAAMWPLTQFTAENGATRLLLGSHLWPADDGPAPREETVARLQPGSLLLWTGGVLHGSGANVTDERRLGAFVSYSFGWLRQEENQYLDLPPAAALALPRELRRLAGYRMHAPGLGYADADDELLGR